MISAIIKSMRPKQWVKNILVFAGLIFSRNVFNINHLIQSFSAFLAFCFISSAVYVINDILDINNDRIHPEKQFRPIASGNISIPAAILLAVASAVIAFIIALSVNFQFTFIIGLYFILLTFYSLCLKRIMILDVLIISSGFVLRAIAGAVAIGVSISSWLLICTIFLALFLSLCKRRNEIVILGKKSDRHRPILAEYSIALIDQFIAIVTGSALISYSLYTTDDATIKQFGTDNLIYTVPFVIFGIFRYLYLVYQKNLGGSPDRVLLEDKPVIINNGMWLITVVVIIYLL